MKFKLNPLTGEFDYTSESANKQKLNPLTWEFNLVEGDWPFSQIFNPLTGSFNLGQWWGWQIITEVTGNWYINLINAVADGLMELKAYGWTEQTSVPSPINPADIVCNNWVLKVFSGEKFSDIWVEIDKIINWETGDISNNASYNVTDYIELKKGRYSGQFYLAETGTKYFRCWSYTNDGTPIKEIFNKRCNDWLVTFTFDVDEDCIVRMSYRNNMTRMSIQPATSILYVEGTTETIEVVGSNGGAATAEALFRIAGYKDEQNIIDWKITRNVKAIVLDWTEDWVKSWNHFESELLDNNDFSHLVCTHFSNWPVAWNDLTIYKFSWSSILQIRYDAQADVDSFKSWLAAQYNNSTPVIVLYVPETPTKETVAGQAMSIPSWDGTIQITQASIDNLPLYAKYLSYNNS